MREAGRDAKVFAACRFRTVAEVENFLADDAIAMVGMARAHIADPALVNKARDGREAEQRPCIGCNQGCAGFLAQSLAITCLTNPAVGREAKWGELSTAPVPRRVLVVGGGPAGMEAAAIAAARGHQVALWESGDRLGGALAWTRAMPKRADFGLLLDAQVAALQRAGVAVRLGRAADAASIAAHAPDAVVLATGATEVAQRFPDGGTGLTMQRALADQAALPQEIAVVDTLGSWALAGFVEWLAGTGRTVTLVAPTGTPGWQVNIYSSYAWRDRLRQSGVRIIGLHAPRGFDGTTLALTDLSTGAPGETLRVGAVVAPTHGTPNDMLAAALRARNAAIAVHLVGDCASPRGALEAVFEGHAAGRNL